MTLAVDLMFCEAALAKAVAKVAAWGELAGGDPAARTTSISSHALIPVSKNSQAP